MQNLTTNLTNPNPQILSTWSARDQEVIYSHCGMRSPVHGPKDEIAVKIKDYTTPKQFSHLAQELLTIQRYKGIRELLGKVENERMVSFIRKEFGDFNYRELWTAMDVAAAPENPLELKYGGQVTDFTNDYLSRVLQPYRKYRAAKINRYLDEEAALIRSENVKNNPVPELSTDQVAERELALDIKFCQMAYDASEAKTPFGGYDRVYNILSKHNLISFTEDRLKNFQQTAKDRMAKEARSGGRAKTIFEALNKALQIGVDQFEMEWKRVAIEVFMRECNELCVTPTTMFQQIIKKTNKTVKKAKKASV